MFINRFIDRLASTRRRRQVSFELGHLSDYQLDDIGLSRLDLIAGKRRS
jgi:uncharacterized protein YjiS (DUF1127 family)